MLAHVSISGTYVYGPHTDRYEAVRRMRYVTGAMLRSMTHDLLQAAAIAAAAASSAYAVYSCTILKANAAIGAAAAAVHTNSVAAVQQGVQRAAKLSAGFAVHIERACHATKSSARHAVLIAAGAVVVVWCGRVSRA